MRIVQVRHEGKNQVAIVENKNQLRLVAGGDTYAIAKEAIAQGQSLATWIAEHATTVLLDYQQALDLGNIQVPCMHPDPAHCLVSGTGLTHLGSAKTRSQMHAQLQDKSVALTDSMKMFQAGLSGGKPTDGTVSSEPEWFYKGDGAIVVAPNAPFVVPEFAEDAGEEPEIAGIYLIDDAGNPVCLGYCLGNEFSDHIKERRNYLLLAHSKLRPCSLGPEMHLGDIPKNIQGTSRILRNGDVIWEKPFLTGEDNMTHSFADLAYHHFKYAQFRRKGDLHIHFFGTATLSFADGIKTQAGDVFEIKSDVFGEALKNTIEIANHTS